MVGVDPLTGPLHMRAEFGIMMPKSMERQRNPRTREWRVKKPDLDNLLKLVKDAGSRYRCYHLGTRYPGNILHLT